MRILVAHNRYQQAGGEDQAVRAECALLNREGNHVELWEENNDSIAGPLSAGLTALACVYSVEHAYEMRRRIRQFRPDVVHVHNFFPRLSPSIHIECRRTGVPVVQTLHNFRLLCPAATLHSQRGGGPCEACLDHCVPLPAVVRGCYRGSRLASLAVAHMLSIHRALGTWNRCVDRFIALTEGARAKFIAGGIAADKIVVKPNFADLDSNPEPNITPETGSSRGNFALFVGRLVEEKGIRSLLAAWSLLPVKPRLRIIGDGPLAPLVADAAATIPGVEWLGPRSRAEVRCAMADAAILVLPSTWYEGFPLVIAEAFAAGLPIVASRLGAMAELISDGRTGKLFSPGDADELAGAVESVLAHPQDLQAMRQHARAEYERKYTAAANYTRLMAIYETALGRRHSAPLQPLHTWLPDLRR
jgi:glycosyltransferase involved in cell wall biosynthesis